MNRSCLVCGKWFQQPKVLPMEEYRPQVCGETSCFLKFLNNEARKAAQCPSVNELIRPYTEHSGVQTFGAILTYMRSNYERYFATALERGGFRYRVEWWYEPYAVTLPHKTYRTYVPDFLFRNSVFIEVKGRWNEGDKTKVRLFRKTFPYPIVVIDAPIIANLRRG